MPFVSSLYENSPMVKTYCSLFVVFSQSFRAVFPQSYCGLITVFLQSFRSLFVRMAEVAAWAGVIPDSRSLDLDISLYCFCGCGDLF